MNKKNDSSSVIAAGLALFSMFFGAGDLIWPLIIGGDSGNMNFWTVSGFLITAVSLPLLGLCGMLLFMGDYHTFFSKMGRIPAIVVIFIIQAIVGPIGSIPRLFTLAHATLQPYLGMELFGFSVLASLIVLAFTLRKQQVVSILGLILTPILLVAVAAIVIIGLINHPEAPQSELVWHDAFTYGLTKGYNTLDMIAAFIFAPLVLSYFCGDKQSLECQTTRSQVVKKMFQASLIAAGLLGLMYITMTYVASFYVPLLPSGVSNEGRLSAIALYLLGDYGAFFASIAVVMACLTTAIPLTTIAADYFRNEICKGKIDAYTPLLLVLLVSAALANLGFMGIANLLEPILKIMCPALIVLTISNIVERIYQTPVRKGPVFATFGLVTISYFV